MKNINYPIAVTKERLLEKFFANICKKQNGCWEWANLIVSTGYGRLQVGKHSGPNHFRIDAHRFSYEIHHGPIPEGLSILHKCDNRKCVNPDHLFAGTQNDNMQDMIRKGRKKVGAAVANSKITDEDIKLICELRKQGLSHQQIAEKFNLNKVSIGRILHFKAWKHIPREVLK